MVATRGDEPRPIRAERDLLDQPLVLAVLDLVQRLAGLPLEEFDPRRTAQVIDVANLADAAYGQQFAVVTESDTANAANRMATLTRVPGVHDGCFESLQSLAGRHIPDHDMTHLVGSRQPLAILRERYGVEHRWIVVRSHRLVLLERRLQLATLDVPYLHVHVVRHAGHQPTIGTGSHATDAFGMSGLGDPDLLAGLDVPPDQPPIVTAADNRLARQRNRRHIASVPLTLESPRLGLLGTKVVLVNLEIRTAIDNTIGCRHPIQPESDALGSDVLDELQLLGISGHVEWLSLGTVSRGQKQLVRRFKSTPRQSDAPRSRKSGSDEIR